MELCVEELLAYVAPLPCAVLLELGLEDAVLELWSVVDGVELEEEFWLLVELEFRFVPNDVELGVVAELVLLFCEEEFAPNVEEAPYPEVLLAWFDVLFCELVESSEELLELGDVEDVVAEPLNELVLEGLETDALLVEDEGEELTLIFVS